MPDISTITSAVSSVSGLLVVSPQSTIGYQPQSPKGSAQLPSLLFHYEGEQALNIQNGITDHYVEDNTAIQANIAIRPIEITTQGYIGELMDFIPKSSSSSLNSVVAGAAIAASKLALLGSYVPGVSATALIAYNNAVFAYQTVNAAVNAGKATLSSLSGSGGVSVINGSTLTQQSGQNNQQTMLQTLFLYNNARTLFTVQTPWVILQNMAIKSIRAVQDSETTQISDFEITFKQMRFATTATQAAPASAVAVNRTSNQLDALVDNGYGSTGSTQAFATKGVV